MKRRLIAKITNYLPTVISILLVFFVIAQATSGIFDTDIWLHLKTGKEIVKNFSVAKFDTYSFTISAKRWVNHAWLFQVITYLTYRFSGVNGLIFTQTLFIALAFLVLFLIGFKDNRHIITTALLSILVVFASSSRFNLRPDILSLIFFAIFLHQLKFNRQSKVIYILVFWQLLWVNCHGYFFLGPVLILIFILAELIRRFMPKLPGEWSQAGKMDERSFKRLIRLFFLTLIILFTNPQFFTGAIYPFEILKDIIRGHSHYAFKHVAELANAFSLKGNAFSGNLQLNILVLITLFSLVFGWRKLDITYILLFICFLPFGLIAVRNVSFLSFITYVIIVSRLESMEELVKRKVRINVLSGKLNILAKGFVICVLIWFMARVGYSSVFKRYYDFEDYEMKSMLADIIEYRYPKRCVDFILENNLPPNLFNDFNSGAYLIFHAYPQYQVFIDGRTELYSQEFFDKYFKIMNGDREIFDAEAEKFNINTVLLNNATALMPKDILKMLYEHPKWQLVFFDEQGVVFLKRTRSNAPLIKSLSVDLKRWQAPPVDLLRLALANVGPDPYIIRARLLDALDLEKPLISEVTQALKISPSSGQAHFYLAKTYFNQDKFFEAFEHFRLAYIFGHRTTEVKIYLAKTYLKLGDKEKALTFFKKAQEAKPDDEQLKEFIANLEKELEE